MARILIILSEFKPLQTSGINRLSFFKDILEEQGHFVAVLTTLASAQGVKTDKEYDRSNNIYRAFSLSLLARRILSSRKFPIYPKLALKGKYDVWVPFAISKGKSLVRTLNIDTVLSSFPDFNSIHAAEKIATLTSKNLIIDFRDPPYWIYDGNTSDRKTLHCQKIIKKAIENSNTILACTQQSKESIQNYYKNNQAIEVIGNGYDAAVIDKLEPYKPRNDQFFEIVHIGSFYNKGRDIRPIVRVLEKVSEKCQKKIKLRLIGDAPEAKTKDYINKIAQSIIVTIEPPVSTIEALSIAKQADALLLLQGSRFDRQVPAKVYEYLALNRPIWAVVGMNGATHTLLKSYEENVIISDYNAESDIEISTNLLFKKKTINVISNELSRQEQCKKLNVLFG